MLFILRYKSLCALLKILYFTYPTDSKQDNIEIAFQRVIISLKAITSETYKYQFTHTHSTQMNIHTYVIRLVRGNWTV